jgi:hypothetical protein
MFTVSRVKPQAPPALAVTNFEGPLDVALGRAHLGLKTEASAHHTKPPMPRYCMLATSHYSSCSMTCHRQLFTAFPPSSIRLLSIAGAAAASDGIASPPLGIEMMVVFRNLGEYYVLRNNTVMVYHTVAYCVFCRSPGGRTVQRSLPAELKIATAVLSIMPKRHGRQSERSHGRSVALLSPSRFCFPSAPRHFEERGRLVGVEAATYLAR